MRYTVAHERPHRAFCMTNNYMGQCDFFFTATIACTLALLTKDPFNKVTALAAMLPRVIDPINITGDCFDYMNDAVMAALEHRSPDLFYFVPTNPTGHYKLELGRADDKRILKRLVCICAEEKRFREEHNMLDLSQKGDGEVRPLPVLCVCAPSSHCLSRPVSLPMEDWCARCWQSRLFLRCRAGATRS
eukprot:SAG11_NODE_7930_length_1080_cov_0.780836_2_plen_189_part_00